MATQRQETPLQAAKRRKEAFVAVIIDRRHLGMDQGRIEAHGPVNEIIARMAVDLFNKMARDDD